MSEPACVDSSRTVTERSWCPFCRSAIDCSSSSCARSRLQGQAVKRLDLLIAGLAEAELNGVRLTESEVTDLLLAHLMGNAAMRSEG